MKKIILRTASHHLVMAFTVPLIEMFLAGPQRSGPDVLFWGSRVFTFSTMDDESLTFTEAFSFALVEGQTATRLSDDELKQLAEVEPFTGHDAR